MSTKQWVNGPRRHYGLSPRKYPSPSELERKAKIMEKAVELERKQEKKHRD